MAADRPEQAMIQEEDHEQSKCPSSLLIVVFVCVLGLVEGFNYRIVSCGKGSGW